MLSFDLLIKYSIAKKREIPFSAKEIRIHIVTGKGDEGSKAIPDDRKESIEGKTMDIIEFMKL